jgi:single-strand DNA-binding protein
MDPYLTMQGRLVADPTQHSVSSGLKVTRFRLAANGRRYDEASSGWVNTETVYMSISCWRQLGDNVMLSLKKGDAVVVRGRVRFREYETEHGRRQSYEIEAQSVGPDLARYVVQLQRPVRDVSDVPPPAGPEESTAAAAAADADPWGEGGVAVREQSVA